MSLTQSKLEQKSHFGNKLQTEGKSLTLKGKPGYLELIPNPDTPLPELVSAINTIFRENRHLIPSPTKVVLNFTERYFDEIQFEEIQKVLRQNGAVISGVLISPDNALEYLNDHFNIRFKFPTKLQLDSSQKEELNSEAIRASDPVQKTTPALSEQASGGESGKSELPPREKETPAGGSPSDKRGDFQERKNSEEAGQSFLKKAMKWPFSSSDRREQRREISSNGGEYRKSKPPETHSDEGRIFEENREKLERALSRRDNGIFKVMRTCRAGTSIFFDGDVIVFGDLNPGAEIRATGDIIVLGSLRGIAHAGCRGNPNAKIFAADLSPTQIRLANQIAISPPDEAPRQRQRLTLEMAYLNEQRQIEVKTISIGFKG